MWAHRFWGQRFWGDRYWDNEGGPNLMVGPLLWPLRDLRRKGTSVAVVGA